MKTQQLTITFPKKDTKYKLELMKMKEEDAINVSIDLIEEHQAKLESLTKKSYMSSTDYQRAIINLIDKAYESKK